MCEIESTNVSLQIRYAHVVLWTSSIWKGIQNGKSLDVDGQ